MSTDDQSNADGGEAEDTTAEDDSDGNQDSPTAGPDQESDGAGNEAGADPTEQVRERLEREADRAVEQFDQGVVDLLSWVLDTETRARIYVHLRQDPDSTSEEVAEGTGLYPSTVREALAALHEEGKVRRGKRENSGAGNNPYEYSAIPPSDLVGEVVQDVQDELNAVCNLDRYLEDTERPESEPVTITVTDQRGTGVETPEDGSQFGGEFDSNSDVDSAPPGDGQ